MGCETASKHPICKSKECYRLVQQRKRRCRLTPESTDDRSIAAVEASDEPVAPIVKELNPVVEWLRRNGLAATNVLILCGYGFWIDLSIQNLDSHISTVSESLSVFKSSTQDDFRELREEIGDVRGGLDAVKLEVNKLNGELQIVTNNLESVKEELHEVKLDVR